MQKKPLLLLVPALVAAALVVSCGQEEPPAPLSPPPPSPTPTPTPPPPPPPPPPPTLEAHPENWTAQLATPGNWFYAQIGNFTYASFGNAATEPLFSMRCDPAKDEVSLGMVSDAGEARPMRFLTETTSELVTGEPRQGSVETLLAVDLKSDDPLLDAIALSKGKFAVQAAGEETLYIPAWTEISRVIEDCR
jgi:hypothetical protein